MKRVTTALILVLIAPIVFNACSPKSWEMDYGKPAAQFHEKDVSAKGGAFVGKKITVKGMVEKVDTSDPGSSWILLSGGTRCNFGKFRAMAESCKVGEEVYVDGFLKRCSEGDVLVEPAMLRDSKAPFEPTE